MQQIVRISIIIPNFMHRKDRRKTRISHKTDFVKLTKNNHHICSSPTFTVYLQLNGMAFVGQNDIKHYAIGLTDCRQRRVEIKRKQTKERI